MAVSTIWDLACHVMASLGRNVRLVGPYARGATSHDTLTTDSWSLSPSAPILGTELSISSPFGGRRASDSHGLHKITSIAPFIGVSLPDADRLAQDTHYRCDS